MINYIEYLNLPTKIGISIVGLFFVLQIIGELLEFKGKIVPEYLKVRKYFKRKRKEREALSKMTNLLEEYIDMLPSLKAVMNIQGLKSTDLIITKVTGFSQSAGVAIRSRLVSVNGIEIKDKASLVDVLYGFESGDSIDIVVQVTTDIYKTHTIVA